MKKKILLLAPLALCAFALIGCGTHMNLVGLSVGLNVAQKGLLAAATLLPGGGKAPGTDTVNVSGSVCL